MNDSDEAYILGVDNGKSGYMSLWCPKSSELWTSKISTAKGALWRRIKHFEDDARLKDYRPEDILNNIEQALDISSGNLFVVLEEPLSNTIRSKNTKSIQDMHRAIGIWQCICSFKGILPFGVHPVTWKSHFGLFGKEKDASLVFAKKLMPNYNFRSTDAADSFLIAKYFEYYLVVEGYSK